MIAALFVAKGGCYFDLNNVDPWDAERDAREYRGPHPVVAHPPCQRWGRYYQGGPRGIIERMSRKQREATPLPFRDLLISIAENAVATRFTTRAGGS